MTASIAMRNLPRLSLEQIEYHDSVFQDLTKCPACWAGRAEQIRNIVRQTGLTMAQISTATVARYGKESAFFVPPSFLHKQRKGVSPHVCQVLALSLVTGYRFRDWMTVCGFDLRWIFALQLKLHVDRTVFVTPDSPESTPWLSMVRSKSTSASRRYLFAKIGRSDAVLSPKILSGSVVRADRCYPPEALHDSTSEKSVWLVEHPGGLTCCRVTKAGERHIVLKPSRPPLPPWPLHLNTDARVLGLVDLELRLEETSEGFASSPTKFDHRLPSLHNERAMSLSKLIRLSRSRTGLTLREAQELTTTIARSLGNPDYRISLGQLSDYEATDRLPRHIAKLMSLCVVYGIDPMDLMAAAGLEVDDSDKTLLELDHDGLSRFPSLGDQVQWAKTESGTGVGAGIGGSGISSQVVA